MLEKNNSGLSIRKQCNLLSVNRSSVYYKRSTIKKARNNDLKIKIKRIYLQVPFYGYRKIAQQLRCDGDKVGKNKVLKLKNELGLNTIYPKKNLSKASKKNQKYPYLLKGIKIKRINQVWETDITYLKLNGSHVYLVAIIDVFSRKVMSYSISNSMTKQFCIDTLESAILQYGKPDIFNTDQGAQFTSNAFLDRLRRNNIKISMVGKGRATDNIYIERLWRSLKYEEIYLKDYRDLSECKKSVKKYFEFYNQQRFHQSLNYLTPDEIFYGNSRNERVA